MSVAVIVQARSSSSRLPGKVLASLGPDTVLGLLLARLGRLPSLGHEVPIVVATSTEPDDDAVADAAETRGFAVYRGPLDDVLGRVIEAGRAAGVTSIARVCADSPWLDPSLVAWGLNLAQETPGAVVSNVRERTFPRGQSVEIVPLEHLERAHASTDDPEDLEHVTRFLHRTLGDEGWRTFRAPFDASERRLVVDTPFDLQLARTMVSLATEDPVTLDWASLLPLYDAALAVHGADSDETTGAPGVAA